MDRKENEIKLNKKAQINLKKLQIFLKKEDGKKDNKCWFSTER
jgi:hypothetical protein